MDEIIPGVEDMQVQFGIDPSGTLRQRAALRGPGAIPIGAQVVSVRIWLLVRAENPEVGFRDTRTYQYGDRVTATGTTADLNAANAAGRAYVPADDFRRLLVSRTIQTPQRPGDLNMTNLSMRTSRPIASKHAQRGAALVVGMLLLLVLTLLAISGMNTASLELAMAGNMQYRENAFQAAESGVEQAMVLGAFNPNDAPERLPATDGETTPIPAARARFFLRHDHPAARRRSAAGDLGRELGQLLDLPLRSSEQRPVRAQRGGHARCRASP